MVWRPSPARPERVAVSRLGRQILAVAEECKATLEALGLRPTLVADCGVAGVHRLLEQVELLETVEAVVVIAGMEGALASLVGGLAGAPVVAVPTSAGYGASFQGLTALLAMMASCAPGVCVVGIDNGFGAAWAVGRILGSAGRTARHVPPTGASPTGASPTGASPTGASPPGAAPPGGSPAGPSPTGRSTPAIPSLGDKLVRR